MWNRDAERREDEPKPEERHDEEEERRPKRRLRWLRDAEVKRSVNAAVQDADFDR